MPDPVLRPVHEEELLVLWSAPGPWWRGDPGQNSGHSAPVSRTGSSACQATGAGGECGGHRGQLPTALPPGRQLFRNFHPLSLFLHCLSDQDCRESHQIREASLTATSQLCSALQAVLKDNPGFTLARHEELLLSAIAILQVIMVSEITEKLLTFLTRMPVSPSQLSSLPSAA